MSAIALPGWCVCSACAPRVTWMKARPCAFVPFALRVDDCGISVDAAWRRVKRPARRGAGGSALPYFCRHGAAGRGRAGAGLGRNRPGEGIGQRPASHLYSSMLRNLGNLPSDDHTHNRARLQASVRAEVRGRIYEFSAPDVARSFIARWRDEIRATARVTHAGHDVTREPCPACVILTGLLARKENGNAARLR